MPRLNVVTPDKAEGEVKEIYDDLQKKMGKVINIFQGLGNSAAALKAYLDMAATLKTGQLETADREAVYLAVSENNGCNYCAAAHTAIAKGAGIGEDQILAFRKFDAPDEKRRALLQFLFNHVYGTELDFPAIPKL
jgi:AhpD family alkylhydroperoxidase